MSQAHKSAPGTSRRGGSGGAVVIVLASALLMLALLCAWALLALPAPAAHANALLSGDTPIDWVARPVDFKNRHITVKNGTYIFSAISSDTTRKVIDQVAGDVPCLILDQAVVGVSSQYTDFFVDCGKSTKKGFVERPDLVLNPPPSEIPFAQIDSADARVNVRAEPSAKSKALTVLYGDGQYEVIALVVAGDATWLRLVNPGPRTYWSYGWVSAKYLSVSIPPSPAVDEPSEFAARLKVGAGPVNVRALYGTQYDKIGTISERKNSYRILSWITPDNDVEWWEIEYGSGSGWVRSDFFDKEQQ